MIRYEIPEPSCRALVSHPSSIGIVKNGPGRARLRPGA